MFKHSRVARLLSSGRKRLSGERGSIIAMFAASLVFLIFFVGLAVDVSMVLWQKNRLSNAAQMVKNNRFVYQESIRYAQNPGDEFAHRAQETLKANGYKGSGDISFNEYKQSNDERKVAIKVTLNDQANTYFLRLFSKDTIPISSSIEFEDTYGYYKENPSDSSGNVVWHPSSVPQTYNGHYKFASVDSHIVYSSF